MVLGCLSRFSTSGMHRGVCRNLRLLRRMLYVWPVRLRLIISRRLQLCLIRVNRFPTWLRLLGSTQFGALSVVF